MYFEGIITIDPSELTKIERIKPTKVFKRILYHLTFGEVSEKLERETFTAVSILQQLNAAFLKKGIDNIIRLSHDSIDFYLDENGKKEDLKEAFDMYELKVGDAMSTNFNDLLLVLEHDDEQFKYLLEVTINRDHSVGEHPIEIKVTGLLKEFNSRKEDLKKKIGNVFSSQDGYDTFKREKLHDFTTFLDDLILCIKQSMSVDNFNREIKTKIVVPETKVESKSGMRTHRENNYHGLHYGYHGFDDFLFYSMLWSTIGHENSVLHTDTYYESDIGSDIGYLEEADSSGSYFDDSMDMDSRTELFTVVEDTTSTTTSSSGSWFDFGDFGDSGSDSGGSSCSSCSSCGGD